MCDFLEASYEKFRAGNTTMKCILYKRLVDDYVKNYGSNIDGATKTRHIVKIIIIILDQATGSRTMDKIVLKITHQTS